MNGLGPCQIKPCPFGGNNIGCNNVALNVVTSVVCFQASMYDKKSCRLLFSAVIIRYMKSGMLAMQDASKKYSK